MYLFLDPKDFRSLKEFVLSGQERMHLEVSGGYSISVEVVETFKLKIFFCHELCEVKGIDFRFLPKVDLPRPYFRLSANRKALCSMIGFELRDTKYPGINRAFLSPKGQYENDSLEGIDNMLFDFAREYFVRIFFEKWKSYILTNNRRYVIWSGTRNGF
jgi:hypothetical protein